MYMYHVLPRKKGKQHFIKVIKTNKYTVVLYTYVIEYFDKEYEYE